MPRESAGAAFAFCPYDGSRLAPAQDHDGVTRGACAACGFMDYRNPKPGVAVLMERAGRILLARRGTEPRKGTWDIPGGFIDAGETAEQAVRREMREETGLELADLHYFGSYPDTYGRRDEPVLSFCFTARADTGDPKPASDVSELAWFASEEIPHELAFPHQQQILRDWRHSR